MGEKTRKWFTMLRVISITAGFLLVLFSLGLIISMADGIDASAFTTFYLITIVVVLPAATGLFLIFIAFRKKSFSKTLEAILTILTGYAWVLSGLLTAALSIRNISQERHIVFSIMLILVSLGVVTGGFFLLRRIVKKGSQENIVGE